MSPEMLTLVAAVLAYDMAREMCEVRDAPSSMVDAAAETPPPRRSDRSCTRLENDIAEDAGMVEPRGGLGLRCDPAGVCWREMEAGSWRGRNHDDEDNDQEGRQQACGRRAAYR